MRRGAEAGGEAPQGLRELADALGAPGGREAARSLVRDGFNGCVRLLRSGRCAGLLLFAPPSFFAEAREQRGTLSVLLQALQAHCLASGVPYVVLRSDGEAHRWFSTLLRRQVLTCVGFQGPGGEGEEVAERAGRPKGAREAQDPRGARDASEAKEASGEKVATTPNALEAARTRAHIHDPRAAVPDWNALVRAAFDESGPKPILTDALIAGMLSVPARLARFVVR